MKSIEPQEMLDRFGGRLVRCDKEDGIALGAKSILRFQHGVIVKIDNCIGMSEPLHLRKTPGRLHCPVNVTVL